MTTSDFLSGSMEIEGNQRTYMKHRRTNYDRVKSMQIKECQSKAMTCKYIQRTINEIWTRHLDAQTNQPTNQPTNKQTNKQNTNLASNQSKELTHLRTNQITKPTNQQMHRYANETNEPTNELVATHISFRNLISICIRFVLNMCASHILFHSTYLLYFFTSCRICSNYIQAWPIREAKRKANPCGRGARKNQTFHGSLVGSLVLPAGSKCGRPAQNATQGLQ